MHYISIAHLFITGKGLLLFYFFYRHPGGLDRNFTSIGLSILIYLLTGETLY